MKSQSHLVKMCINCKQEKPLDQYGKHKQTSDGLRIRCRECCKRWRVSAGSNHKVCNTCKQEKELDVFITNKKNKNGKGAQCQACKIELERLHPSPSRHSDVTKAYREKNREHNKVEIAAWRNQNKDHVKQYEQAYSKSVAGCFHQYKANAKRGGRVFELSKEQFESFWQKSCTYCGMAIATIGLDRVDSAKGYTLGNVVSCCTCCNRSKLDLDLNDWLEHIRRIIEHQDRHKA